MNEFLSISKFASLVSYNSKFRLDTNSRYACKKSTLYIYSLSSTLCLEVPVCYSFSLKTIYSFVHFISSEMIGVQNVEPLFVLLCVTEYALWQWEDEHGRWNPYNLSSSLDLEDMHQGGATSPVTLMAYGRAYTVDVAKMEQTNDVTGVVRKVKRAGVKGMFTFINTSPVKLAMKQEAEIRFCP